MPPFKPKERLAPPPSAAPRIETRIERHVASMQLSVYTEYGESGKVAAHDVFRKDMGYAVTADDAQRRYGDLLRAMLLSGTCAFNTVKRDASARRIAAETGNPVTQQPALINVDVNEVIDMTTNKSCGRYSVVETVGFTQDAIGASAAHFCLLQAAMAAYSEALVLAGTPQHEEPASPVLSVLAVTGERIS